MNLQELTIKLIQLLKSGNPDNIKIAREIAKGQGFEVTANLIDQWIRHLNGRGYLSYMTICYLQDAAKHTPQGFPLLGMFHSYSSSFERRMLLDPINSLFEDMKRRRTAQIVQINISNQFSIQWQLVYEEDANEDERKEAEERARPKVLDAIQAYYPKPLHPFAGMMPQPREADVKAAMEKVQAYFQHEMSKKNKLP